MDAKKPYRDLIEALGVSSWIGVVNNPWFDYCLPPGFFEIDVKKRTATYCKPNIEDPLSPSKTEV